MYQDLINAGFSQYEIETLIGEGHTVHSIFENAVRDGFFEDRSELTFQRCLADRRRQLMGNASGKSPARWRSIRFIGSDSQDDIDRRIIEQCQVEYRDYTLVISNSRMVTLVDSTDFSGLPNRVVACRLDDWTDTVGTMKAYNAAIHADPDELIFQFEPPPELSLITTARKTGHWVTCGIVASDITSFMDSVARIVVETQPPLDDFDILNMEAIFLGHDLSEFARDAVHNAALQK